MSKRSDFIKKKKLEVIRKIIELKLGKVEPYNIPKRYQFNFDLFKGEKPKKRRR